MRQKNLIANLAVLFASAGLYGQNSVATTSVAGEVPSKTSSSLASYYIDPLPLHLNLILSPPPARDSATAAAELTELHRIEAVRTPAQIAQAQADDHEEDIFVFKTVLGPGFTAEALPVTASLSGHVRKEESAAGSPLKKIYHRPRPYQVDSTLHPVCPPQPGAHVLPERAFAFRLSTCLYSCATCPRETPTDLRSRRRVCPQSADLRCSLRQ
jgi:acid phosphatase (class A)